MIRLATLLLSIFCSNVALGALHIRDLDGNWSNGHEGVYDDVLDITWLADANYALSNQFGLTLSADPFDEATGTVGATGRLTWDNASLWINNMNSVSHFGYANWRLPTLADTGSQGCDFSFFATDCGYNVQTAEDGVIFSELAYMYFVNFSGESRVKSDGSNNTVDAYGIENVNDPNGNTTLFQNIQNSIYWTGVEYSPDTSGAWYFLMFFGSQDWGYKDGNNFAWAVHDGDIGAAVVPLPATAWLFLSAIGGLFTLKHRAKNP